MISDTPPFTQQEHVIAELKEYMTTTPPPPYADNVALTVQYLEACNKIFERGILGHVRIWSGDSAILHNMEEGYKFFCTWINGHLQKGKTTDSVQFDIVVHNFLNTYKPIPLMYHLTSLP